MARAKPRAHDRFNLLRRHVSPGWGWRLAEQLFKLYELAGFFRCIGGQISRMPGEEEVFVSLPFAGVRDARYDEADLIERQIPKQIVRLPGLNPCFYQRRPVYPAVAVLGRASPPFGAFGCISSNALPISVPASSWPISSMMSSQFSIVASG